MAAAGVIAGVYLSGGCASRKRVTSTASPAAGSGQTASHNPQMRYRRLGRTGLMISEVVLDGRLGGSFSGRPAGGEVAAEVVKNRTEVVSRCIDLGINYVDITSGGEAVAYGAALKGRREKMHIAADDAEYAVRQNRHRNSESQMQNIESCLRKLGTDRLDVWRPQFKPMGGHRDIDLEMCIAVFEKARSQGKVRFLGMSTQDRSWMRHVIERFPQYTVVYVSYVPGSADPASADRELLETAHARDVSLILVKASGPQAASGATGGSGQSIETDSQAVRSSLGMGLSNPNIAAVAIGMDMPSDVDSAVQALRDEQTAPEPRSQ